MDELVNIFNDPLLSNIIISLVSHSELCKLACVCQALKKEVYNPKWWTSIELPFLGTNSDYKIVYFRSKLNAPLTAIYSHLSPPKDSLALEKILAILLRSKERFVQTKSVHFKNLMFSDASLELAIKTFPSLERLNLDGGRLTATGLGYVNRLDKLRYLDINCRIQFNLDAKDWLNSLESHLERLTMRGKFKDMAFLKKCVQCHTYFNPKFNSEKSCLYHPDEYLGYGHSCSCFQCCGSNTPCYMGTPGCTYGIHSDKGKAMYISVPWIPEFYDIPYTYGVDLIGARYVYDRRDSDSIE